LNLASPIHHFSFYLLFLNRDPDIMEISSSLFKGSEGGSPTLEDEKSYPKKEQNLRPFFFLEIIFKIFNNGFRSKTHIFNILF